MALKGANLLYSFKPKILLQIAYLMCIYFNCRPKFLCLCKVFYCIYFAEKYQ